VIKMSLTLDRLLRMYNVLRQQLWLGAKDFNEEELEELKDNIEEELSKFKLIIVRNGRG